MKNLVVFAALLGVVLGLGGCRTLEKAPGCKGPYVPVNSAERYPQETRP